MCRDLHVDTVTAVKIRELARQKDEAVAREDYDTAKMLKVGPKRMKDGGYAREGCGVGCGNRRTIEAWESVLSRRPAPRQGGHVISCVLWLQASIERLKVVGQKIAQLEARKRAAVEKEDYDTAKVIKVGRGVPRWEAGKWLLFRTALTLAALLLGQADIDKLRAAGEGAAMAAGAGVQAGSLYIRVNPSLSVSTHGCGMRVLPKRQL